MLTEEQILERNKLIGENGKHTREKRKTQICKTFRFKIDWNRLNKRQKECLKMMFVEAKWIYNYIISQEDIKSIDYKTLSTIIRKDKDKNDISTQIQYLGSSIKQELIAQILNQIKGLSVLKKKGHKVGRLKYKSEINSTEEFESALKKKGGLYLIQQRQNKDVVGQIVANLEEFDADAKTYNGRVTDSGYLKLRYGDMIFWLFKLNRYRPE